MQDLQLGVQSASGVMFRGTVTGFTEDGAVLVASSESELRMRCNVLSTADGAVRLREDDTVLCWIPSPDGDEAIILGRIEPTRHHEQLEDIPVMDEVPDEIVIEARKSLTLRVGSGSITIREDGKILIKGKDLVSHATRLNRIKGGAVQIN